MSYEFEDKIDGVTDDLDLSSDIATRAKNLVSDIIENDYVRKFSPYGGFDAIIGMAIYTAAHQERRPIDPQMIEDYFKDSEDFEVTKHFYSKKIRDVDRMLVRELDLDKVVYKPSDFVRKARQHIYMEDESWNMVDRLLDQLESEEDLTGRSPKAIAGAAIYIVSVLNNEEVTQADLNDSLSLSDVAIRYTYKNIIAALTELDTDNLNLSDVEITATTLGIRGEGKSL